MTGQVNYPSADPPGDLLGERLLTAIKRDRDAEARRERHVPALGPDIRAAGRGHGGDARLTGGERVELATAHEQVRTVRRQPVRRVQLRLAAARQVAVLTA